MKKTEQQRSLEQKNRYSPKITKELASYSNHIRENQFKFKFN